MTDYLLLGARERDWRGVNIVRCVRFAGQIPSASPGQALGFVQDDIGEDWFARGFGLTFLRIML